jgi:hypothetical protein
MDPSQLARPAPHRAGLPVQKKRAGQPARRGQTTHMTNPPDPPPPDPTHPAATSFFSRRPHPSPPAAVRGHLQGIAVIPTAPVGIHGEYPTTALELRRTARPRGGGLEDSAAVPVGRGGARGPSASAVPVEGKDGVPR